MDSQPSQPVNVPVQLRIVTILYMLPIIIFVIYVLPLIISNIFAIINGKWSMKSTSSLIRLSWYPILSLVILKLLRSRRYGITIAKITPLIVILLSVLFYGIYTCFLRGRIIFGTLSIMCMVYGIITLPSVLLLNTRKVKEYQQQRYSEK